MAKIQHLFDEDGVQFSEDTFYLSKSEYAKIISEINTYYKVYEGERYSIHESFGVDGVPYLYYFENHGYNKYNIYNRVINELDLH